MVNLGPGVSLPVQLNAGNIVTFLAAVSLTSRLLAVRMVQESRTIRRDKEKYKRQLNFISKKKINHFEMNL